MASSFLSTSDESESVWNLFVQILLPIILILTFTTVLSILKYQLVAEQAQNENKSLRGDLDALEREFDPARERFKRKRALLTVQRQKLLLALEQTKQTERVNLKLQKFMSGTKVILAGSSIQDEDFKELSVRVKDVVSKKQIRSEYYKSMYKKVLEIAGIKDEKRHVVALKPKNNETFNDDEVRFFKEDIISPSNRALVHNDIVSFVRNVRDDLKNVQVDVLGKIFDYLTVTPEMADDTIPPLVECMLDAQATAERQQQCALLFYKKVIGGVKSQIAEYEFLEETWATVDELSA